MRKNIVAGNWKMNKTFQEAEELIDQIVVGMEKMSLKCDVIACPPAPYLEMASDYAEESRIKIGAQNVSEHEKGAFTGEVAAPMLASVDIEYCIVGHSERRKYFNETHKQLAKKIDILLDYGVKPIFCCGEVLEEREKAIHFDIVKKQLEESLFHLNEDEFTNVVVAYEPVWAIGTGKTATEEQAQEAHSYIRNYLKENFSDEAAEKIKILYGGSVKPHNIESLIKQPDLDGALVGGASLDARSFSQIIKKSREVSR